MVSKNLILTTTNLNFNLAFTESSESLGIQVNCSKFSDQQWLLGLYIVVHNGLRISSNTVKKFMAQNNSPMKCDVYCFIVGFKTYINSDYAKTNCMRFTLKPGFHYPS